MDSAKSQLCQRAKEHYPMELYCKMEHDKVLFRVDEIITELRSIWGISSIKGTYLLNGRYLVNVQGSHTELIRDLTNEVIDSELQIRITDYDQRCDALFLMISDPKMDGPIA